MTVRRLAAAVGAVAGGGGGAVAEGAAVAYLNAPASGGDLTAPPRLRISFGARSYDVVMDTGSTGIVVSADKIPNVERLPSLGPGRLTYSSSGRIMIGRWVVTPLTIMGRNGASVAVAPIAVLAVDRVECTAKARRCTPREGPRGISMLGIGFARRHDHQEQSGPSKNPFLNVATVNGGKAERLRRGYLVTRQGVFVGLTAANTQGDFAYVKLERADEDWAPTPVCISINGAMPAACGSLLMDTGVTAMYLTVPASQAPEAIRTTSGRSPTLIAGTKIAISVPTEASAQALYAFTLGERGNPLAPAGLHLVSLVRPPFVNTSVHFLNGFDYLYDADGGFVGFRWTGHAAPTIGKVVPSAAPPAN
jgi:predicted aspartyl protease